MRTPRNKNSGPNRGGARRKPANASGPASGSPTERVSGREGRPPKGQTWLYGHHAVAAALDNPDRVIHRVVFTGEPIEIKRETNINAASMSRDALDDLLPPGAVHQGYAALVNSLPAVALEDICQRAEISQDALVVVLDQVSDPQNIGAILRSAAVFGALAVIVQDRHAPEVTGAMAKAASGAVEHMPLVRVTNIVRGLDILKNSGFWCIGLDSEADTPIERAPAAPRQALVLGAEGPGMRRLTADSCDLTVRIESEVRSSGPISSLNVSNAAAVALYALSRAR
jgi:23S rRNA (guanosine2251-2'-O)-methyltransferase